jgi:hypothetical protein
LDLHFLFDGGVLQVFLPLLLDLSLAEFFGFSLHAEFLLLGLLLKVQSVQALVLVAHELALAPLL